MPLDPEFLMEFPKLCLAGVLRDVQFSGQFRGQKSRSGTWIYLSKLLLQLKVSFYLRFYPKAFQIEINYFSVQMHFSYRWDNKAGERRTHLCSQMFS